ncbi:hypothetical protein SAICODRAFT_18526 [Saitoella complicata NRRL Y-17804]|uniref:SNF7 family protein n=1 Tax=Saitoella complicata (strain BCRC 22490 / CBS 7301 / JCM 7358 / NBRC 10748 / NRRL Y-17804) TaxID=698492 RepID=A0A0E9NMU9_SAICN|nr:uncharacterized protein SAICODRAFT_18526 [Saitoella complicata NRRL Y-17804]ODQ53962.1 hypothetical protein SAICODRAFT_18526 [Saitoella complicata NRRL Y-17804]GAO51001.1 hypothetical protein G7K_5114-t1 [Saitoella complicata NRRL Y-17804]
MQRVAGGRDTVREVSHRVNIQTLSNNPPSSITKKKQTSSIMEQAPPSTLCDFLLAHPKFTKARLPSLFSDFTSQRESNPDGYAANVTAWKSAIEAAAKAGAFRNSEDRLVLETGPSLLRDASSREWGSPLGLGAVIASLLSSGDLIPLTTYTSQQQSIYASSSWSVGAILSWGFRKVIGERQPSVDLSKTEKYVMVQNLESAANNVLRLACSRISSPYTDPIYSTQTFTETFAATAVPGTTLSATDVKALLTFLSRDKGEIRIDGDTIKFKSSPGAELPAEITEADHSVAKLHTAILNLTRQIDALTERSTAYDQAARAAVSKGQKTLALSSLKSKKLAEVALGQRAGTLHQLQEIIQKVDQANTDASTISIMESGAKVLEGLMKDIGGVQRVDEVVDRVRRGVEDVDEVSGIIAELGKETAEVDEDELEAEFAGLMEEGEKEEKQKQKEEEKKAERTAEEEDELLRRLKGIRLDGVKALDKEVEKRTETEKKAEPLAA